MWLGRFGTAELSPKLHAVDLLAPQVSELLNLDCSCEKLRKSSEKVSESCTYISV